MKILLIHSYLFETGGDWTYLKNVRELFESKGHSVSLFGIGKKRIDSRVDDIYLDNQVYHNFNKNIRFFKKLFLAGNILFNIKVFISLYKQIKKIKPDYIQLNSVHTALSPSVIVALIVSRTRAKIKWRVLDYKLVCPNRTFISSDSFNCKKCVGKLFPFDVIKSRCKNNSILESILVFLENSFINLLLLTNVIDHFIVQSDFSKKILIKAGINKNKIQVIYNPISVDLEIKPQSHSLNKKKYDVIYFGRLSREKGVEFLIKCLANTNYKLLIIGSGPLKSYVKNSITNLKNIEFIGELWGDELKQKIESSSVTVIPSVWNEVSPYVLLESYRVGVPVLVSDMGGTKDLVVKGVTGEVFKVSDSIDFLNKIKFMLNNRKQYDRDNIFKFLLHKNSFNNYYDTFMNRYD